MVHAMDPFHLFAHDQLKIGNAVIIFVRCGQFDLREERFSINVVFHKLFFKSFDFVPGRDIQFIYAFIFVKETVVFEGFPMVFDEAVEEIFKPMLDDALFI